MPLIGMPILSASVSISPGGMILRIAFWTSANWLALSSTLVPIWVRTCIRIEPASTDGKKLRPRNGTSRNEAATMPRKPITKNGRRRIAIVGRSR